MFTAGTLDLFEELLGQATLSVASATFEQDAQRVITAKQQIAEG